MTITPDTTHAFATTADLYDHVLRVIAGLVEGETDRTANLANASAALAQFVPNINWVGFYVFDSHELVLAPFQGHPACIRIKIGKGVCGTAALLQRTIIVPDVSAFDGHIGCNPDTRSEIVVPMFLRGQLLAVLDVDSASLNRFNEDDRVGLQRVAALLTHTCDWPYGETIGE
ncbi:MAG: GAF domain-containing protein [bacterium]|nr:GAF domain-containing protein [bacterium]